MALVALSPSFLPRSPPSIQVPGRLSSFPRIRACSTAMSFQAGEFTEFPFASPPVRDLMAESVATVERRLSDLLKPCELSPDVRRYSNSSATADGALHIRSGAPSSTIDFILGSWLHCKLPTGAALNISSLMCYLNDTTDSPHFVLEVIQSSDESMVLILDLVPRKDFVLHPDYLQVFYEDMELDKQRQILEKIPEIKPYISPSLYTRCVFSPTVTLVRIDTKDVGGKDRLEEIIGENVSPAAKEMLDLWLDQCVHAKREVTEEERTVLNARDKILKSKTIEIDLGSSLPKLFDRETADKVLGVLRSYF